MGRKACFNDGMAIWFRIVIGLCLLGAPAWGQYHPSGPATAVDRDSLLTAGMDELLSYLLLTRDDFVFRDDFTDKDAFRLPIVDSLMRHPLLMNDFAGECAQRFETGMNDPDVILGFVAGLAKTEMHSEKPIGEKKRRGYSADSVIKDLAAEVQNWGRVWNAFAGKELSEAETALIKDHYQDLLLEDPADKDKTAEEQDSISRVEERYAVDVAAMAGKLRFPTIVGLKKTFDLLEVYKSFVLASQDSLPTDDSVVVEPAWARAQGQRLAIGSFGNDVYRGDYDVIIDPGGDDSYFLTYDPSRPHAVLIADFSGNDTYTAESAFALACGAFAYSVLIDYEGDDVYRGGSFSLGVGYFGVGILWDKKGNDAYFGDTFTQGAGTFGLGLLIDSEGSDTYTGNLFCQGFGFVDGVGGIIDHAGYDAYIVQPKYGDYIRYNDHHISLSQGFGYGVRPFLSGGFGFIADYAGNDTYLSDIFGQGASYWWSLGVLYDRSGNDQYLSHQYAQGNGTHMSLGILRDDGGNDVYRSYGVSQGCGHDYSCGWLLDRDGDDTYISYDLSQGAGQANGFGVFTDVTGNDRYYVMLKTNTQGYGNPRRDYGSIGIFLDLDGDDRYDGNGANNRFWTTNSKWGGGLDRQIPVPDTAETK